MADNEDSVNSGAALSFLPSYLLLPSGPIGALVCLLFLTSGCLSRSSFWPLRDSGSDGDSAAGDDISATCGNGALEEGETCDDGNASVGDGCDQGCAIELDWQCSGQPSSCTPSGMERIPAGPGVLGSPDTELERQVDEGQCDVLLTRDFALAATETTQGEFAALMGWDPSAFGLNGTGTCGLDCPVESVSWYDALAYANERSNQMGLASCYTLSDVVCAIGGSVGSAYIDCFDTDGTAGGIQAATVFLNGASTVYDCVGFRLPTEAEWEYAARAGTSTATYAGDFDGCCLGCWPVDPVVGPIAWYCANSNGSPQPVGTRQPNAFGLYDVLGNVAEWCNDRYEAAYSQCPATDPVGPATGTTFCRRGAAWSADARFVRIANRYGMAPDSRVDYLGFRLAKTLP